MSTMRKIIIPLLLFIYLIGSGIIPPLMGIWNKEGYLFGIPYFFVGCWCVSALLVLLTLFLYWYERNDKTFDDRHDIAGGETNGKCSAD